MPRRLRLARGDRQLLAKDVVEQRRLADVRPADDRHVTATADVFGLQLFVSHVRSPRPRRSEEHTSELQSLMRISYAVFCLKKKKQHIQNRRPNTKSTTT